MVAGYIMNAAKPLSVANRWYDRLFRVCLYVFWGLAAWNVLVIGQYLATARRASLAAAAEGEMLRQLPEPFYLWLGGRALSIDLWVLAMALSVIFGYLLLTLLLVGCYKLFRKMAVHGERAAVLGAHVRNRALLFLCTYWVAGWLVYCVSEGVGGSDDAFLYALVAFYTALLLVAGVAAGMMMRRMLKWPFEATCVIAALVLAYFMPLNVAALQEAEKDAAVLDGVELDAAEQAVKELHDAAESAPVGSDRASASAAAAAASGNASTR